MKKPPPSRPDGPGIVTDLDWPEREADMAMIRRVSALMKRATDAGSPARATAALGEARALMPAYAAATARFNAATRRAMAANSSGASPRPH